MFGRLNSSISAINVRRIARIDEQQEGGLRLHQAAVGVFAFDMAAEMDDRFTFHIREVGPLVACRRVEEDDVALHRLAAGSHGAAEQRAREGLPFAVDEDLQFFRLHAAFEHGKLLDAHMRRVFFHFRRQKIRRLPLLRRSGQTHADIIAQCADNPFKFFS